MSDRHLTDNEIIIIGFFRRMTKPETIHDFSPDRKYSITQLNELDAHAVGCKDCDEKVKVVSENLTMLDKPLKKRIRILEDGTRIIEDVIDEV